MAVYAVVGKSKLVNSSRIDAEYFQPKHLEIEDILEANNAQCLSALVKEITCGPFGSAILQDDYQETGIPLIRVGNLNDWFVNTDDLVFIKNSLSKKMERYQVIPGDIVVSQRGTIALFSKVTEHYPKWNISANLIAIKRSTKIDFNYLLAYLNSKFGTIQLNRRISGQVQPKITTTDTKNLYIIVPSDETQAKIGSLINNSWNAIERANDLYAEAENLLLEKLGLKNFEPEEKQTYHTSYSYTVSAKRLDAEFFQPKYDEIMKVLKKRPVTSLESEFKVLKAGNYKYDEEGETGVIKTKQLTIPVIDYEVEDFVNGRTVKERSLPLLKGKDVLFASMGVGSLGKTNLTYSFEMGEKQYSIDSTLYILRRKEKNRRITPEVLTLFLNSWVGQESIYQNVVGSSGIINIYRENIEQLTIPVLPRNISARITRLVGEVHRKRKEAKELLEEATIKVEEMIELKIENNHE